VYNQKVTLKDAEGQDHKLNSDLVMSDDVTLAHEARAGYSSLWIIGHEYGVLCAVWASNAQEALDAAVNADLLDCMLIPVDELSDYCEDEIVYAGNASEPLYSVYLWMKSAPIGSQSVETQCFFAEARGAAVDNLGEL